MRAGTSLRHEFSLIGLLKLAGIPRSTYYYIKRRIGKPDRHGELIQTIHGICRKHEGRYGYRRVTAELRRQGVPANHKLVMRLMKQEGLTSRVRMKKYRSYRGEEGVAAPNLLQRNFSAQRPNQKWVTDTTEFSLHAEKLYLTPVMDLFNGEILSYALHDRPTLEPVLNMMEDALSALPAGAAPTLHSDQGWQYRHKSFQTLLRAKGVRQSMSRKGNCLDNSVMENFFGLLKSELLYLQSFDSMAHFKAELIRYMTYYNHQRIKLKLKGMSPVEYRTHTFPVT